MRVSSHSREFSSQFLEFRPTVSINHPAWGQIKDNKVSGYLSRKKKSIKFLKMHKFEVK